MVLNMTALYERVIFAATQPSPNRHQLLAGHPTEALLAYRSALGRLTPEAAQRPWPGGADDRTIAQIVGPSGGWD